MMYERAFMDGSLDTFEFILAEALHMTIGQMNDAMSDIEFAAWRAFFVYRREMQKLAGS